MNENKEEELSFIFKKLHAMWRRKEGTMFKGKCFGSGSRNKLKDK